MKPPLTILPKLVQARVIPAPRKKACQCCQTDTSFIIHVQETFTPICHGCLNKAIQGINRKEPQS